MSDVKYKIDEIDNETWLKVLDRVMPWFNDKDDALNWFFYQKLYFFGGVTPEEVLTMRGDRGYIALLEYIELKENGELQ